MDFSDILSDMILENTKERKRRNLEEKIEKDRNTFTFLSGPGAQAWREKFVPIIDLKPGDKVKLKFGCRSENWPEYDQVVEVFDIINPPVMGFQLGLSGERAFYRFDFLVGVWVENILEDRIFLQFYYDSRRFERVEK